MDSLVCAVRKASVGGSLKALVEQRMAEFSALGKKDEKELFKEMCFCLLTANYSAEGGIKMQKAIGDGFLDLSRDDLSARLKELGYRFPNVRADFIVKARRHVAELPGVLLMATGEAREWLVSNVKGLGMKEASHFMRNVGFTDVAIVDFHIVDILQKHGLIERPSAITPKRYLEMESVLSDVAERMDMSLGELDLYLWFCETGKVLK